MKDDKWIMFKNYMHNELGITKQDIRTWIEQAVKDQAEAMVKNEFQKFDVQETVRNIILKDNFFGSPTLKREIAFSLTEQIMQKIKFE
jgi:hypothetical protein